MPAKTASVHKLKCFGDVRRPLSRPVARLHQWALQDSNLGPRDYESLDDNPQGTAEQHVTDSSAAGYSAPGSAQASRPPIIDAPADPGLTKVIDAWPSLPEPIKVGILAMVNASAKVEGK